MYPVYRAGVAGSILVSLKFEPWKESIIVNPIRVTQVPRKRHVGYGKWSRICSKGKKQAKQKTEGCINTKVNSFE